ncbi:unnamed protein product [Peniophora sp. CBMAI 1063]|nr:unnamed protein product [Peniophora sp. CBMAI 1063]
MAPRTATNAPAPSANHTPTGPSASGLPARKALPKFKKKTAEEKEKERKEKEEEEKKEKEKEREEKERERESRKEMDLEPGEVAASPATLPLRPMHGPRSRPSQAPPSRPTRPLPRRANQPTQSLPPHASLPSKPQAAQMRKPQPAKARNHKTGSSKPARKPTPKDLEALKKTLPSVARTQDLAHSRASTAASTAAAAPKLPVKRQAPAGYTAAARWQAGALFAYNTSELPPDPDTAPPSGSVYTDALLGPYEHMRQPQLFNARASYMAFIRQPNAENFDSLDHHRWDTSMEGEDFIEVPAAERVQNLRDNFAATVRLLQEVFSSDVLLKDDFAWETLGIMMLPEVAVGTMWKAQVMLRYEQEFQFLQHPQDRDLAWRQFQRSALIVEAFLFECTILLRDVDHPTIKRLLEYINQYKEDFGDGPKRGAILTGDDISSYHSFLVGAGVPTFVLIPFEELVAPDNLKYSPTSKWRCSTEIDAKLSSIKQKDLPRSWYPAKGVAWEMWEILAISGVSSPRDDAEGVEKDDEDEDDDEDEFKPSDRAQALKRKRIADEESRKRLRLEKEQEQELREELFRKKNPVRARATTAERYAWIAEAVPALRSYYDRLTIVRPKYLAHRIVPYAQAESEMLDHGVMLDSGTKSQASYLPPVHIIIGANEKRQLRYLVNFVHLLPSFLKIIELKQKHPDSNLGRFGPRYWRNILNIIWDETDLWAEAADDEYSGKDLFRDQYEHLRRNPSERPAWGKLPCGHDVTEELLEKDTLLRTGLLFELNMWHLLLWLPELVPRDTLTATGINRLKDEHGIHYTPDYTAPDPNNSNKVLGAIKRVVLGGQPIRSDFWLEPWSAEADRLDARGRWLQDMAKFLSGVRGAEGLDRKKSGSRDWPYTSAVLGKIKTKGMTEGKMDILENHLYLRYALASVARGHMPVEFQIQPCGDILSCQACRLQYVREHGDMMQQLDELPDEGPEYW